MSRAASTALATLVVAVGFGLLVAGLVLGFSEGEGSAADVLTSAASLATLLVGGLVVRSRPGNRFGWVFLLAGFLLAALPAFDGYSAYVAARDSDPLVALAWIAEWWWLPMLFSALSFWLFLFPDGHLPGPGWRIPFGFAVGTCIAASVFAALDPVLDNGDYYEMSNPIGIAGLHDVEAGATGAALALLFGASMLAAAASLVVRFRRSSGVERQQIEWITLGGVTLVLGFIGLGVLTGLGLRLDWGYGALFLVVPVTVGVAILRHGLFDIDLVIRRTLVYGALSVLLVAAYAGLVLAGQAVLSSFAGGGDLAIAVSTLVVAALFLPLRSRVQSFVDRRFYRRRYDAQRTLTAFGTRLRDQVELDGLRTDLEGVVRETMQPAYVSLWLREDAP